MNDNITDMVNRYNKLLETPFQPTYYYPKKEKWEQEVKEKIKQLKTIK